MGQCRQWFHRTTVWSLGEQLVTWGGGSFNFFVGGDTFNFYVGGAVYTGDAPTKLCGEDTFVQ